MTWDFSPSGYAVGNELVTKKTSLRYHFIQLGFSPPSFFSSLGSGRRTLCRARVSLKGADCEISQLDLECSKCWEHFHRTSFRTLQSHPWKQNHEQPQYPSPSCFQRLQQWLFHPPLPNESEASQGQLGSPLHWIKNERNALSNSPLKRAEDHSCTDMSGILLASCMAGTTMLLLS